MAQETPQGPGEQTLDGEILSQAGGEPRLPPCLLMCPHLPSEDQAVVEQVNLATGTADTLGQRLRVKPPTKEGRGLAGRGPPRVQQTVESVHQRPRPPAIPGGSGMGRSLGGGGGRGQVPSSPASCRNRRATHPAPCGSQPMSRSCTGTRGRLGRGRPLRALRLPHCGKAQPAPGRGPGGRVWGVGGQPPQPRPRVRSPSDTQLTRWSWGTQNHET